MNLYPWDAGTEDGSEFSLSNANTSPKGAIASIRGRGKFTGEHIARLVFTRIGSVEQAPAAPTGFGATPSDAEVTLNWDVPTVTGITGHEYRRKTEGDYGGWTAISDSAPSGANEDSFTVTGLTNDTAYTFQLRAVNSVGGGVGSAEASATPLQSAGTLVLNVGAIAGDDTINIAEKAAGFSIAGDTGSEGGVAVTVTVGTTELTATSADADPATWSVSVPADASYITGTSVDVEVNAAKTGYTSPGAVERPLAVDLVAPTAPTYTAPASLKVGVAIAAMSPTGGSDIDEYSATGLPSGLSIDSGAGAIGGTPDSADADTATATVTGTDTAGNTATADIAFPAVEKGDQTLTGFQYSASSVTFGSAAPTVTAPSGVLTTLSYTATPATVCTVSGSIAYRAREDGKGLSVNLGSRSGATASGVQSLWTRQNASGLARGGAAMHAARRLQAELGYGLDGPRGRALWIPYLGAEAGEGASGALRFGVKLTSGPNAGAELEIRSTGLGGLRESDPRTPEGGTNVALRLNWALHW